MSVYKLGTKTDKRVGREPRVCAENLPPKLTGFVPKPLFESIFVSQLLSADSLPVFLKTYNVSVWLVVIYDEFCGQDSNYVCFSKTSLCVVSETVWLIYVRPGLVYRTISGWARMKVASNQTLSEIWVSGWRVEERIAPLSTFKACHCLNLWWPLRLQFHHRITAEVECFRLASHIFLGGAPF